MLDLVGIQNCWFSHTQAQLFLESTTAVALDANAFGCSMTIVFKSAVSCWISSIPGIANNFKRSMLRINQIVSRAQCLDFFFDLKL